MKIIDLFKRKKQKEEALERAEELLMLVMAKAKSPELNDYIMQSDILKQTAEVFYDTEIAKEKLDENKD